MKSSGVSTLIAVSIFGAFVIVGSVSCTSIPKPSTSPEEAAAHAFRANGERYLEICEATCSLPGLFGDEIEKARRAKIEKFATLESETAVSSYQEANDYANRYNRAMLSLATASRGDVAADKSKSPK